MLKISGLLIPGDKQTSTLFNKKNNHSKFSIEHNFASLSCQIMSLTSDHKPTNTTDKSVQPDTNLKC
jgi:hypothetical protein